MTRTADIQEECDMKMLLTLSVVKDKQSEVKAVCYVASVLTCLLFHSWLNI